MLSEDVIKPAHSKDLERRISELENQIKELYNTILSKTTDNSRIKNEKTCAGRDLNPGQGLGKPWCYQTTPPALANPWTYNNLGRDL